MPIRSYAIEFFKNLTPQDFPLSACWSAIRSTNTRHIYPDFSHNKGEWCLNINLLYQKKIILCTIACTLCYLLILL